MNRYWVVWIHCWVEVEGTSISHVSSAKAIPERGRSAHLPPIGLWAILPTADNLPGSSQVQVHYTIPHQSVLSSTEGKVWVRLRAGAVEMCLPQRLADPTGGRWATFPVLWARPAPSPMGNSFDWSSWVLVAPPCWLCSCRSYSWIHPNWACDELELVTLVETKCFLSGIGPFFPQ